MKLQYLGTAAAEGFPALFCRCDNCRRARELGGRNIRTRSQALIDSKILIDWPSDTYFHGVANGVDFTDVRTLLITHVHEDHFYPEDLGVRKPGFAHLDGTDSVLTVYGSQDIVTPLKPFMDPTGGEKAPYYINVQTVEAGQTLTVEGDYLITALAASHGTEHPLCWVIEHDGKALLYAHDTSDFSQQTWETLARAVDHLDYVSADCTEVTREIDYVGHMNLPRNIEFREKLRSLGLIDDSTRICLNHFSHNAQTGLYEELLPLAAQNGFEVSYDGMQVEF